MKTTIQKNVLYGYFLLGGLLLLVVHSIGVSKGISANAVERFSDSIGQLILEVYAVYSFGLFVIISSLIGWFFSQQYGQLNYVKTFKLTLLFGIMYYLFLIAFGYIVF